MYLGILCFYNGLFAQDFLPPIPAETVYAVLDQGQISFQDPVQYYVDSMNGFRNLGLEHAHFQALQPMLNDSSSVVYRNLDYTYWIRFAIDFPDTSFMEDSIVYFYWSSGYQYIKLFQSDQARFPVNQKALEGGSMAGKAQSGFPQSRDFLPIHIVPGSRQYIWVRLKGVDGVYFPPKMGPPPFIRPALFSSQGVQKANEHFLANNIYRYNLKNICRYILLFIFCVFFIQFLISKNISALYYAGYVVLHFCYFQIFFEAEFVNSTAIFFQASLFPYYLINPFLLGSYFMYFFFVRSFLDLDKTAPKLDKQFKWIAISILCLIQIDIIMHIILGNSLAYIYLKISMLMVLMPIGLYAIIQVYRLRTTLSFIIVTGTLLFYLGSILGFLASFYPSIRFLIPFMDNHSYTLMGVLIEALFFSAGLGKKQNWLAVEKERMRLEKENIKREQEFTARKLRYFTQFAHEFRHPLTVILGNSELLKKHCQSKETSTRLAAIQKGGDRLSHFVDKILDLEKLAAGKIRPKNIQANLPAHLSQIVGMYDSVAAKKEIRLSFFAQPQTLWMDFDPEKLQSILENLISNAIKFIPTDAPRKEVKISCIQISDTEVQITVADSGIGISKDQQPIIFAPFEQVEGNQQKKGSGLGLAITQELVRLMGGHIHLNSKVGEGSQFTVLLPISHLAPRQEALGQSPSKTHIAEMPAPLGKSLSMDRLGGRPTILVAEDHPDVRSLIQQHLKGEYHILEAWNGQQALELIQRQLPDLVISDWMMPKMNGYELLRAVKMNVDTRHIGFIMLSAKADVESRLKGLEKGVYAYLKKPFDHRELMATVKNALQQSQLDQGALQKAVLRWDGKTIQGTFERKLLQCIGEHYSKASFGVAQLAKMLQISEATLSRRLKKSVEISQNPGKLIRTFRMKKARELLRNHPALSVGEISYMVGFWEHKSFTAAYRKTFGLNPIEDRNMKDVIN